MGIFRPKIKIFHRALFQILGYHASKTCLKFMKNSENFSFINVHVVTKNHRFQTDIWRKKFHGSFILLQNTKILFLINIIILIAYYFKKDFENESQENFCKNTSKKEMVFFFTSVFENLSYDSFSILFLLDMLSGKEHFPKILFLNFRVK